MILRDRADRKINVGDVVVLQGWVELVPGTGPQVLVRIDDSLAFHLPAKSLRIVEEKTP